jgi:hypothetical protein
MSSSLTNELRPIAEAATPTVDQFRKEILPGGQPAVLRGIARDWPLVIAANRDAHEAMSLLEKSANGTMANVLRLDAAKEGRFHYARDGLTLNFIRGQGNVAGIIAGLREQESSRRPF